MADMRIFTFVTDGGSPYLLLRPLTGQCCCDPIMGELRSLPKVAMNRRTYGLQMMGRTQVQMADNPKPIVFFDGSCPLCSPEVAHYRKLDSFQKIQWVDITRDLEQSAIHGRGQEEMLRRFHVPTVGILQFMYVLRR